MKKQVIIALIAVAILILITVLLQALGVFSYLGQTDLFLIGGISFGVAIISSIWLLILRAKGNFYKNR